MLLTDLLYQMGMSARLWDHIFLSGCQEMKQHSKLKHMSIYNTPLSTYLLFNNY